MGGEPFRLKVRAGPDGVTKARDELTRFACECGVDQLAVSIVISELVDNAVRHAYQADEPGWVLIRACSTPHGMLVTVADQGREPVQERADLVGVAERHVGERLPPAHADGDADPAAAERGERRLVGQVVADVERHGVGGHALEHPAHGVPLVPLDVGPELEHRLAAVAPEPGVCRADRLDGVRDLRPVHAGDQIPPGGLIQTGPSGAVTIEGTDKRSLGHVMQLFNSAATGTLKNTSYLERNDGKRLFLEEYVPPGKDGFGARFIFLRMPDGMPFLTPEVSDVRFVGEVAREVKLNMRFKVSDMLMDGKLEY